MFGQLTLLLVLTVSTTVLSQNRSASAGSLANTLCQLADGTKGASIPLLGTQCTAKCNIDKKRVVFVCDNSSKMIFNFFK